MKALITGIDGFVGPYLAIHLKSLGYTTVGTYLVGSGIDESSRHMDITNKQEVLDIISEEKPDYIYHLAGFSSVAASFSNPEKCMDINVNGTKNLLDSVKSVGIKPRFFVVSSAEVYGVPDYLPLNEKHPLTPQSPYAESRVEQERLCIKYAKKYGFHIVISRSFNHTGPGQSDAFVLSSFAKQISDIEKGLQQTLKVGNLDAVRDFSDVRDVVIAYQLLMEKGKSREIYNVCSGKYHSIKELLNMLVALSTHEINIEVDPARKRPSDIPVLYGDNKQCIKQTGWQIKISIEKTLSDLLEYWRAKLY
ncbi:MAG TPA: GDP-mannose 4,6-dehydratase [Candidatus Lokiarchaeia archaeon]|nr:GDP-mannose 4,6-dehydratase [Candidatus Lokiarchaeia archaeon]